MKKRALRGPWFSCPLKNKFYFIFRVAERAVLRVIAVSAYSLVRRAIALSVGNSPPPFQ